MIPGRNCLTQEGPIPFGQTSTSFRGSKFFSKQCLPWGNANQPNSPRFFPHSYLGKAGKSDFCFFFFFFGLEPLFQSKFRLRVSICVSSLFTLGGFQWLKNPQSQWKVWGFHPLEYLKRQRKEGNAKCTCLSQEMQYSPLLLPGVGAAGFCFPGRICSWNNLHGCWFP